MAIASTACCTYVKTSFQAEATVEKNSTSHLASADNQLPVLAIQNGQGNWKSVLQFVLLPPTRYKKNSLAGGFHFLITLFFPVIQTYTRYVSWSVVYPTVVNLWLRIFGPRRTSGTNRSSTSIIKTEKLLNLNIEINKNIYQSRVASWKGWHRLPIWSAVKEALLMLMCFLSFLDPSKLLLFFSFSAPVCLKVWLSLCLLGSSGWN